MALKLIKNDTYSNVIFKNLKKLYDFVCPSYIPKGYSPFTILRLGFMG